MELTIKQLKQNSLIFVPQTAAEAVLVKDNGEVITLDKILSRKTEQIITPAGSGLLSFRQESNVIITHSNSITANETPQAIKVKYDNRGHVVETAPLDSLSVVVDEGEYLLYNGAELKNMLLGNDFGIDLNKIILKWNNI